MKNLFLSDSGNLLHVSDCRIIRANYCRHTVKIENSDTLKAAIRAGAFTNIGGYPVYFIAADGEALSFDAVRENFKECLLAMKSGDRRDGWLIVAMDVNYESDLVCSHTNKPIAKAYD